MSLKNLIALQKQKQVATESNGPAPALLPTPAGAESEAESNEAAQVASPPESAKPKGLGLNLVGKGNSKPANPEKFPSHRPKPKPAVSDSGDFSLEDLAAMDASAIDEVSASDSYESEFPDEIEATAPDRELPADLTAEQISFVESLDGIYGVLHDSEMFGQAVRMIMIELQENQEYEKLLSDSDVHTMIRGMRRTMGLARVRKQEKSRKAKTNTNARKKAGVSDDAMALLNGLMGGGDD